MEEIITNKKVTEIGNIVVASSVLAELFNLTDRRIRELAQEGVLVKIKRGNYDLVKSIQNYILHLKANNDIKNMIEEKNVDYDEEHALLEKAKREKAELELQVMKGEVHLSKDVEKVMTDMLANFRGKILSMPSKLAPFLVSRKDVNFIQEEIQKQCYEVLEELKDYNPSNFHGEEYIDIDGDIDESG